MEKVVEKSNLENAYKRVVGNKGAAGIDRMETQEFEEWLKNNKSKLIQDLLDGTYEPTPVKRVDIPKPKGGTRQLGIPIVIDRFVQQVILQVLTPIFDPHFSDSSYGFRPERSAHQALRKAEEYVKEGREIVVDIDLEKFFDNVNHDILMSRVARQIEDKRMLRIVRKFLQAGIMQYGVCMVRDKGTPQGGPLSPMLGNIMLDDLDKELEKRGHKFCRYADDCNIYVYSQKAGERTMSSVEEFLAKRLQLKINHEKSQVSPCSTENIPGIHHPGFWYLDHIKREYQASQTNH
jgi:RNA-directed DNA polymerase